MPEQQLATTTHAATMAAAVDGDRVADALASVPDAEIVELVVEAFQALGDPTRLRILYALARQPMCVRDVALVVGASESTVSHQLRLLRDRRLVKPRRDGSLVYYAIDDHHPAALCREAEYHADHIRSAIADHPYP
jgi:ArsR family transcriptional regulator, lead/cadmium/zinc/bismuth-responsive transcriptional repressor